MIQKKTYPHSLPKPAPIPLKNRLEYASKHRIIDDRSIETLVYKFGYTPYRVYSSSYANETMLKYLSKISSAQLTLEDYYFEIATHIHYLFSRRMYSNGVFFMLVFLDPLYKKSTSMQSCDELMPLFLSLEEYRSPLVWLQDFNRVIDLLNPGLPPANHRLNYVNKYPDTTLFQLLFREMKQIREFEAPFKKFYKEQNSSHWTLPWGEAKEELEHYRQVKEEGNTKIDIPYTDEMLQEMFDRIELLKEIFIDPFFHLWTKKLDCSR